MAYQAKGRDPIFDSTTQALIEQRGKELLGLGLLTLAAALGMILGSYSPEDPGWLAATDGPAQNLLGPIGANIASPLALIIGMGAWGIVAALVAWGARFVLHQGEERALGRAIFVPIAVALASVYASTLVPGPGWSHTFGLGGLFGDTMLGAVLGVLPVDPALGLKALSFVVGFTMLAIGAFALGFSLGELRRFGVFLVAGVVMTYAGLHKITRLGLRGAAIGVAVGATGAMRGAAAMKQRRAMKWAQDPDWGEDYDFAEDESDFSAPPPLHANRVARAEPPVARGHSEPRPHVSTHAPRSTTAPQPQPAPPQRQGLLARVQGLAKRAQEPQIEPELVEQPPYLGAVPEGAGASDRISAKIANALMARRGQAPETPAIQVPEGDEPMSPMSAAIASAAARAKARKEAAAANLRAEPPLMRGAASQPSQSQVPPLEEHNTFEKNGSAPQMSDHGLHEEDSDLWEDDFDADMMPDHETNLAAATFAARAVSTPPARKVVQHTAHRTAPSNRARAEAQPSLNFDEAAETYELPPLGLLTDPSSVERHHLSDEALEENARMLEAVLDDYGVKGEIVSVHPGPVVTMYELEPAPGLKASRVIGLADDIARSMSALSARVSTVPGRSVIGIELPNEYREKVVLREILSARDFGDTNSRLPLALGKDIGGRPIVANLAKMPHLLIAGTTGSGKSVAINTMILSLLYRLTPEECRLIMIDPKMLELSVYDGIPHLLSPVVTDPKKAVVALKWVVGEMEERYRKMSKMGVRNIEGYNGRVKDALDKGEMFSRTVQTGFDEETGEPIFETEEFQPVKLPYIVVVVDEMADLMMVAGKEIEAAIQRLAQMARASGIHLIMATQRPSVDVITGTIKANFPTRISFQVTSKIDSRTILGEQGAEQLLGMGDMLYMAGGARITRVHGPFVSDEEVEEIVNHLKSYGMPEYVSGVVEGPDEDKAADIDAVLGLNTGGNTTGDDALYDQAVGIVIKDRKCSTSYIQRKLGIGYNKAARLVEQMEDEGLVSASNHVGKREILVPEQH
jgi:DNA segregation ATPase FtsK/SpoIIIE, S-DNA-T family